MPHRKPTFAEVGLEILAEIEQPQGIRDGGAAFADSLCGVFLCESEGFDE